MTDNLIMLALGTALTLVSTIFWRWVSSIEQTQDKNTTQVEAVVSDVAALKAEVYRDYQSKNESRHDNAQILEMLREIKTNVSKLNDKLDRKADK